MIGTVTFLEREVQRRVGDPAFDQLADMFDETLPEPGAHDRLAAMQDVAARHWDFRKGAERQETAWDTHELADPDTTVGREIFRHTGQLGLVASTHPILPKYKVLGETGAANKAPCQRFQYGVEQGVAFDHAVLLGSTRPITSDSERQKSAEYAPGAVTEFDLMCGAAQKVLGVREYEELRPRDVGYLFEGEARVRQYEAEDGTRVSVLDAPAPMGKKRANTGDTYKFMREYMCDELDNETDVLFSTNAFYKPAQHIGALIDITLATGAHVETIGFDAAYGGVERLPTQLLQETKSYIDALGRLEAELSLP
jgi:hypothetical protein